jgi:antitoxin ParD1/3/4
LTVFAIFGKEGEINPWGKGNDPPMNVSLTPELERLVQDKVRSGRYLSASEVVREALRLLEDQDRLREMRLEELRREIAIGLEQAERKEVAPLDMEEIKAKSRKRMVDKKSKKR